MSSDTGTTIAPEAHKSAENPPVQPSIKLKASLAPMTALELTSFEPKQFSEELAAKVAQAPSFFENLPVVIGLEKYEEPSLDFERLIEICQAHQVKAIAVRGASASLQDVARNHGLGILAKQKERNAAIDTDTPAASEPAPQEPKADEPAKVEIKTETQISKIVHHPIRSGQQVYAADGDLIILASVSAGAEILADGNIHVYGTLRGRALAGVKGNTKARIFCQSMAAELVSVAGQYKISEDIPSSTIGKPCQVYLDEQTLNFQKLEL
ncbi:MAG: septum site-determining protein MinC [Oleiphilaceae bacterium]|nr:septum site-determining protein MinC [Oleiphilaceae bacterium]